MNVPHTLADIKRFFDIYGAQVPGLRGKTTKRHVSSHRTEDAMAKLQITNQQLVADVVHVAGEKFLLSISSPLELLLVYHLSSLTAQELGNALQKNFNTLHSRGFEPKVVYVDPQSGLKSLQGSFPGIEIDVSGAGDHLDKIDTKTRRLKELMRSVVAGLPYKLKRDRVKDLVTYAVSCTNLKSTSALATNVCPRVRFTGFKPDYQTEFGLSFGDYVETYNPTSKNKSNDIFTERTQPCIALYPAGNRNGSWVFWGLSTKSYVRRSQWKRLLVSQKVIYAMNSEAGDYEVMIADAGIEVNNLCSESEVEPIATHVPKFVPELPSRDAEAQLTADEFNDTGVPELGYFDDDDMSESGESEHGYQEQESDVGNHYDLDQNLERLQRSQQENAGKRTYDDSYEWNLMNLSDGRMQDRTVYMDYSSPTAKTRSIMACLKLAALKDWGMLKLDIGGAFLCAPINDEEVFMFLDEGMSGMCVQFMPEYEEYLRADGRLVVKVNKAMYGLIQSAKLWYEELTGHLVKNGFKVCKTDECVLVKKTAVGKCVVVLLYVDDILVYVVKALLEDKYEKVTHSEGKRLPYLGMTIIKTAVGYEVTMSSNIDTLKLYGKPVREYITPAKQNIFEVCKSAPTLSEKAKFHSVVVKLLYLRSVTEFYGGIVFFPLYQARKYVFTSWYCNSFIHSFVLSHGV